MAKRKGQRRRTLPERQQLVMQRADQHRNPNESPRIEGADPHIVSLPPVPLFTQPSLFEGVASAFDPFPTMDDSLYLHLGAQQVDTISLLSDYLALVADRARVDARFRRALYQALMRLSGEIRALPSQANHNTDDVTTSEEPSGHRRLRLLNMLSDRLAASHG